MRRTQTEGLSGEAAQKPQAEGLSGEAAQILQTEGLSGEAAQRPQAEGLSEEAAQRSQTVGLSAVPVQKLSKRLQAVADFVTAGYRLADIGTDHGYVPIALVQRGIIPSAIAMDINRGPLERAKEHIREAGLESRIATRLSDGLDRLQEGEADSVILAGMGGMLMIRILDTNWKLASGCKELVLEPQSDAAKVREYVRLHGMCIDREELVSEDGKFYPILHVVSAVQAMDAVERERELVEHLQECLKNGKSPEDDMQERMHIEGARDAAESVQALQQKGSARQLVDQYGSCLIRDRHPVLLKLLARDELIQRNILDALPLAGTNQAADDRRREVLSNLMNIRALQQEMASG